MTYSESVPKDAPQNLADLLLTIMRFPGTVAGTIMDIDSASCLHSVYQETETALDFTANATRCISAIKGHASLIWSMGIADTPQDIVITLDRQWHIIHLLGTSTNRNAGLFLYLVLDRDRSDLAACRQSAIALVESFKLSSDDKETLHRLRKEAIRRRTSFLYYERDGGSSVTEVRETAPKVFQEPTHRSPVGAQDEEELPAFMREDTVRRLLGLDDAPLAG